MQSRLFLVVVAATYPSGVFASQGNSQAETDTDDAKIGAATNDDSGQRDEQVPPKSERWIHRWAPERNMAELGAFGGVYLPGSNHELFSPDPSLPDQGFQELSGLAPEIGARIGYYPLRFFGMEVEGGAMPTQTAQDQGATLWNIRGSVVGQLGKWSLTPFALVGAGGLGVSSSRSALGDDVDPTLHFGGGLKVYLSRKAQLRLDLRDVVSNKRGLQNAFQNHNFEALVGVSMTLGRAKSQVAAPADTDGDGIVDRDDSCIDEAGVAPDGCPVRDSDLDGVLDPDDACVMEAGPAPTGCPVTDTDGDGVDDDVDQCVDEPGLNADGCPSRDTDGDGLFDADDACIDQMETPNGFEDSDGCPDEVPAEVQAFSGVLDGISFDTSKPTIRPRSIPQLDQAVDVLTRFPGIRVEISGHTDNRGERAINERLSKNRAVAVRDYLVAHGIAADRIVTRGAGPDEPIANNKSRAGRAKNRRIEFKVIE